MGLKLLRVVETGRLIKLFKSKIASDALDISAAYLPGPANRAAYPSYASRGSTEDGDRPVIALEVFGAPPYSSLQLRLLQRHNVRLHNDKPKIPISTTQDV